MSRDLTEMRELVRRGGEEGCSRQRAQPMQRHLVGTRACAGVPHAGVQCGGEGWVMRVVGDDAREVTGQGRWQIPWTWQTIVRTRLSPRECKECTPGMGLCRLQLPQPEV